MSGLTVPSTIINTTPDNGHLHLTLPILSNVAYTYGYHNDAAEYARSSRGRLCLQGRLMDRYASQGLGQPVAS